jgi:hypothetical protein
MCKLVKQGTMDQAQVIEILRSSSRICNASAPPADTNTLRLETTSSAEEIGCKTTESRRDSYSDIDIRPICRSILLRLSVLRDRISAAGEAILPPSRAIMGPPFVHALDFLHSLVLSAAASSAAAGAALGAASAAEDAEMEVYATAAGGCSRDGDGAARTRPHWPVTVVRRAVILV